jgi:acetate CoA/acetoacetate CoA-transferase beta subunit
MADIKARIAARAAKEFKDGFVANLGIGLPTLVADYLPEDVHVVIHSENGFTGLGGVAKKGEEDYRVINAGGGWVTHMPFANFFGSEESFSIIRGRHGRRNGSGGRRQEGDYCHAAYTEGRS